jgi:hypothetical protein
VSAGAWTVDTNTAVGLGQTPRIATPNTPLDIPTRYHHHVAWTSGPTSPLWLSLLQLNDSSRSPDSPLRTLSFVCRDHIGAIALSKKLPSFDPFKPGTQNSFYYKMCHALPVSDVSECHLTVPWAVDASCRSIGS